MVRGVSEAEICQWCIAYVARALGRPAATIDPQANLAGLGVDSAMAVYLTGELEEWLGCELPPEITFEHPTIAELAHWIATEKVS